CLLFFPLSPHPRPSLFPYTTLFRSVQLPAEFIELQPFATQWARPTPNMRAEVRRQASRPELLAFYDSMLVRIDTVLAYLDRHPLDRKSTRLNSSHRTISYAVFCLKK